MGVIRAIEEPWSKSERKGFALFSHLHVLAWLMGVIIAIEEPWSKSERKGFALGFP